MQNDQHLADGRATESGAARSSDPALQVSNAARARARDTSSLPERSKSNLGLYGGEILRARWPGKTARMRA